MNLQKSGTTVSVLILVALAAVTAESHHSFSAQYDASRPATVEGMVTKFEWHNPHVYFYMDVVDADGAVTEWEFEMSNTAVLQSAGWNRRTLQVGDLLRVDGALARDGSALLNVTSVFRQDSGEKLF
jgi:hypothetical protein